MEIPLFEEDVPLRVERAVLYPYPDLKRIWTRIWLTAVEDDKPNVEVIVYNPNGTENCSVFLISHADQRVETTLHMRDPISTGRYLVVVELTRGIGDDSVQIDRHEFELILEFRDPDKGEPGFGFGVDWDEVKRKAAQS